MLFSSAGYPVFLAAVFFLYGLSRNGRWPGALARMALMLLLGDIVYLLLVKQPASLWDPIGGLALRAVTATAAGSDWAPWWHYLVGSAVVTGAVALGLRAGPALAS